MSEPTPEPHQELSAAAKAFAKRLGSGKARERQKAENEVQEMGADGRDLLIAIMRHEEQQRKSRREQLYTKLALYPVLFGIPCLLLYCKNGTWRGTGMMMGNVVAGLFAGVIYALVVTRTHTNAAHLMATHFEEMGIIRPLAEALEYRSKSVREAATAALVRLLPHLQETDNDLLTSEQRNNLCRALMGKNPELVLAVLQALQQVGDSKAMPNVQKLASGLGVAGTDNRIQATAQQTLLLLRQRVEAQSAPTTLLRAASASKVGHDVLLRPANSNVDNPPEQLLRASHGVE